MTIKDGKSRHTGNIKHTRHRTRKNKHKQTTKNKNTTNKQTKNKTIKQNKTTTIFFFFKHKTKEFEDSKGIIGICKSKDRYVLQYTMAKRKKRTKGRAKQINDQG